MAVNSFTKPDKESDVKVNWTPELEWSNEKKYKFESF